MTKVIKISDPDLHFSQAHRASLALKESFTTEEYGFMSLELVSSS